MFGSQSAPAPPLLEDVELPDDDDVLVPPEELLDDEPASVPPLEDDELELLDDDVDELLDDDLPESGFSDCEGGSGRTGSLVVVAAGCA